MMHSAAPEHCTEHTAMQSRPRKVWVQNSRYFQKESIKVIYSRIEEPK